MRSNVDYNDQAGALGLLQVEWNEDSASSGEWMNGGTCSSNRIDTEVMQHKMEQSLHRINAEHPPMRLHH